MSQFYQIAAAIQLTEQDYAKPLEFSDSSDLAVILQGDNLHDGNPKQIRYMSFTEESLDENGMILDAWGNPIRVETRSDNYRLQSAGPDGVFEVPPEGDDLIFEVDSSNLPKAKGQRSE